MATIDAKAVIKDALVSGGLGLTDETLDNLADVVEKRIRPDSFLRTKEFRTIFAVTKGVVESFAKFMGPYLGPVVEKMTDFGDFLSGKLGHDNPHTSAELPKDQTQKLFDVWSNEYKKELIGRFSKAKNADDTAEIIKQVMLEVEFADVLAALFKEKVVGKDERETSPSEGEKTEKFQSFGEWFTELRQKLGEVWKDWTTITPEEEKKWNNRTTSMKAARERQEWVRDPWGRKKYMGRAEEEREEKKLQRLEKRAEFQARAAEIRKEMRTRRESERAERDAVKAARGGFIRRTIGRLFETEEERARRYRDELMKKFGEGDLP
ncbi:MAG: hypothetical protein Q7S84_04130 [bacterium]|nr:hypothetical protein [bacterium]